MENRYTGPIVLLTDFGETDPFVGILKGVIAGINRHADVIDLSHGVTPQDVGHGAFLLAVSYAYFPKQSIFCTVVDPGVGSQRKGICIRTRDYLFVGPDNGILWAAANENGIRQIVHLEERAYFLETVSSTFHGRDIFAPVCAHISKGMADLSVLGSELTACKPFHFPDPDIQGNRATLTVLCVDRFGNITLNISPDQFDALVKDGPFDMAVNGYHIRKRWPAYAAADDNELFVIAASNNRMEISLKNGSAADKIRPGTMNTAVLTALS